MESKVVRKDGRVIVHFDYDCFYASVFEAKNPALKSLPFAVQQKQIIVTCNYTARARGLHKLQLITEARRICPDVIIELGEDISRFRDASKELYGFIREFSWNGKVERLGFDEVWMDVTDMVDYNVALLNRHNLQQSFFQMSKDDPTVGFEFDATTFAGHIYPKESARQRDKDSDMDDLTTRLYLGSHVAIYMRHQLEQQKGYTSTVGIATNKLLSKLVGNMNKPKGQTLLLSQTDVEGIDGHVASFMDAHEIGKVPGIGFKSAQKLRESILQHPSAHDWTSGGVKERVTVGQLRQDPSIDFEKLEKLLGGPGFPHGIGHKIWCLLHGIDDSEVSQARQVPRQISIEDSYIRLDTMPELLKELNALATSLINRMRVDLLRDGDDWDEDADETSDNVHSRSTLVGKKWLAHPKTLRLTTRPRSPSQADGTRQRTFKRISHSCPLPTFVFLLNESAEVVAEKLVRDALLGMFRKLHPEKSWWNLSLVNLAVTNMAEAAGDSKSASGRDIGNMFRKQEDVLKDFRVTEADETHTLDETLAPGGQHLDSNQALGSASFFNEQDDEDEGWIDEDGVGPGMDVCQTCGSAMPSFAMVAHRRFHLPAEL